jgi:1,4-dihydroxy-2-naphthoate polyprenyltransferase
MTTVRPGSAHAWLLAIRPRTLPASAAPVILGWALAVHHGTVAPELGAACLAVAVVLQIAANLANDLGDARSGVDDHDRLGPRRVTQSGLLRPGQVLAGIIACLAIAGVIGIGVAVQVGWWLLALGGVCLAGAVAYTSGPVPLARLGLGEAAALVFFGTVACTGTFAVVAGSPTPAAWVAGLIPGLHAGTLMAVNNLRDLASDARAGRRTFAVRFGDRAGRTLAVTLLIGGNVAVAPLALLLPEARLWWSLLLLPASWPLVRAMLRTPRSGALNAVLARSGRWGLLTCLVVGGLIVAG